MKPLSERIKEFPAEQFVDWLCLSCVDVREVRTPEDAQEEINKIRAAVTERLSTLEDKLRIKHNHISLRDSYIEELEAEQSEHDEQIARLQGKFDLAVAGMRSKASRCEKVEAELAEIKKQKPVAWMVGGWAFHDKKSAERRSEYDNLLMEPLFSRPAPTTDFANLVAIGRVDRGEVSDNNEYPNARVVCLHDQADWENFPDGTELFLRPAPAVILADLVPKPFEVFKQAGGVMVAVKDGMTKNHLYGNGYNACIAEICNSIINSGELTKPEHESEEARICSILNKTEEAK